MLSTQTKRHIDAARDVLVGVVPNPMAQIDQITFALIYKFMDDMDQASTEAGGEPSFFVGDLERYSWSRLVDSRVGNQEKMNLYGEALQKFSEATQLPELFRTIFRAAFLPYRTPETLGLFLKEIGHFDYSHPEELGNAYEYLLSIMSAQGDAGQFRTPRHIIDFMVDVMKPTKDDKILDPACGTGGFLVASYNHILEQHDGLDDPSKSEQPLTPDERKKLMNNFEGYDIDPSMVRIAQVNMYLHQFKNPKVWQYDALSNEERWGDKFDLILANPPFMTPKGGIRPHSKFSLNSTRSELLFLDYIIQHLGPNGRGAVIVPEGVIYNDTAGYMSVRKSLIDQGLYGVVSLPAGVFLPYSGVKTSILFIDRRASKSDSIAIKKITSVGVSLNASRSRTPENDLVDAVRELGDFLEKGSAESADALVVVKKSEIAANSFDLSFNSYAPEQISVHRAHMTQLGEVCHIRKGKSSSTKTVEGPFPLFVTAAETKSSDHFDFEGRGVAVPLISARGHGRAEVKRVHFVEGQFALANLLAFVEPKDTSVLLPEFLHYVLQGSLSQLAGLMRGAANVGMSIGDLVEFKIPVPPIEIQTAVVDEINGLERMALDAQDLLSTRKRELVEPYLPR